MKTRTSIATHESKLAAEHNPKQFLQQLNLSLQVGIPFFQVGCSPVQGYELLVQRVRPTFFGALVFLLGALSCRQCDSSTAHALR